MLLICGLLVCGSIFASTQIVITGLSSGLTKTARKDLLLNQDFNKKNNTKLQVMLLAEQGKQTLKTTMQLYGYFQAIVTVNVEKKTPTDWLIEYEIHKGQPLLLSKVSINITGDGKNNKALKRLIKRTKLKPGATFIQSEYNSLKSALQSTAINQGFFAAKLKTHKVYIDKYLNSASIELSLDTGLQYYFGTTKFIQTGYEFDIKFLESFIPYKVSKPYKENKVRLLQSRLNDSGYFTDVYVDSANSLKADNDKFTLPVTVHLKDKKPQEYTIGVGYGTETGARGLLGWKLRHITNTGQNFVAKIEASKLYVNFGASYIIPGANPASEYTSLNVGQSYTDIIPYLANVTTVGINWMRRVNKNLSISSGIHENYISYSTDLSGKADAKYLLPGINVNYKDFKRSAGWPAGFSVSTQLTGSLQSFLSKDTFAKDLTNIMASVNLNNNNRIYTEINLGAIIVDNITDLSPDLRFYAGGVNSLLGYAYKSLSPTINGSLTGGRYLVTGRVSLEHNLYKKWSGLLFYNAGNAFNNLNDFKAAQGAGVGISWQSPAGSMQFFLSRPIAYDGINSWRFDFSIGTMF